MIIFLVAYLLAVLHVFITEYRLDKDSWGWAIFFAVVHPLCEALCGLIWILLGLEKLIVSGYERIFACKPTQS
jgi:peptidoglycan/LPS O-acetylase OafA/YrhL